MRIGNWRITTTGIFLLGALVMNACGGGAGESSEAASLSSVAVSVNPQTTLVTRGGSQRFTATVSGTASTAVTWTVDGIANGNTTVGTVSASGNDVIYYAPSSNGSHILVATSLADASQSDSSTISVRDSCAPAPSQAASKDVKKDYGAKGDGVTDDTAAIQKAVDAIVKQGGGTVVIPSSPKPYLVNAAGGGVILGSNITLRIDSGATLQAITSISSAYNILCVQGSNVNIVGGGTLMGERGNHNPGSGGEQGHGLVISNSDHVVVENVTSRDCWGDGFYVGAGSTNVTLCNVVADNNRRAGISITSVNGLMIRNSIFRKTHGTIGECGLNMEPNLGETVNDVQILGCTFEDNSGPGIAVGVPCGLAATVSNIVIDGNTAQRNGTSAISAYKNSGINISNCNGTRITNNTANSNAEAGIILGSACDDLLRGANHCTVSGNTVSNNELAGIYEAYCDDNTITSNSGTGNQSYGIRSNHCTNDHITGNGPGLPVSYY